jgi:hypothetical protein
VRFGETKEYKKIRRKISEIDELVSSGVDLDYCQRRKVDKRPEYVGMIINMLTENFVQPPAQEEVAITVDSRSPSPDVYTRSDSCISNRSDLFELSESLRSDSSVSTSRSVSPQARTDSVTSAAASDSAQLPVVVLPPILDEQLEPIEAERVAPLRKVGDVLAQLGDWVCECLENFFIDRDLYYNHT